MMTVFVNFFLFGLTSITSATLVQHLYKSVQNVNLEEFSGHGLRKLNILLIGEKAAGKSSFINTVHSSLIGQFNKRAISGSSDLSVTKKFSIYDLKTAESPINVNIADTMGHFKLEGQEKGANEKQYIQMLEGKMKDGYELTEENDASHENENPTVNDKMHCVAIVIDANTERKYSVIDVLRKYKSLANDRDISTCVILTKIDLLLSKIKDGDIRQVYLSGEVGKSVALVAELIGVDVNDVYPVQNAVKEGYTTTPEKILALTAMKNIIQCCKETVGRWPSL